jgi:hypothetical protein
MGARVYCAVWTPVALPKKAVTYLLKLVALPEAVAFSVVNLVLLMREGVICGEDFQKSR